MKYFAKKVKGEKTNISEVTGCQINFCHENTFPKILVLLNA